MLYVTTRDKTDVFTAIHALQEDRGRCGGLYVPYRLPIFSGIAIGELQSLSFGERIARMLNLFFNTHLDGSDIDFAIGRRPVRVAAMSHKIAVIETWHNHFGDFDFLVSALYRLIAKDTADSACSTWFRIAVRISVLFAIFADLMNAHVIETKRTVDISVAAGDFSAPMAIWYARKMGLPIGNIICCCENDSVLWDFFHNGALTLSGSTESIVPASIESLIFQTFGFDQTQMYVQSISAGRQFRLSDDKRAMLSDGMFCAVVRQQRVEAVILNQHRTNQYWMDYSTALGFGGLQDYRASEFETGPALILSDRKPPQ